MNVIKQISKTAVLLICAAAVVFCMPSCSVIHLFLFTNYSSDRPDLYTVAVDNVFGISGYLSNGEATFSPETDIIETDDYGRTMFFYNEYYSDLSVVFYGMAFVIMQKSDGDKVFYYQDVCYMPYFSTDTDLKNALSAAGDDKLEAFKDANDWGKEIDETKCSVSKITRSKKPGSIKDQLHYDVFDSAVKEYARKNGEPIDDRTPVNYVLYCNSDESGMELYRLCCLYPTGKKDPDGNKEYVDSEYAAILSADHKSATVVEITDITMYYDIVRQLKDDCGWVAPVND